MDFNFTFAFGPLSPSTSSTLSPDSIYNAFLWPEGVAGSEKRTMEAKAVHMEEVGRMPPGPSEIQRPKAWHEPKPVLASSHPARSRSSSFATRADLELPPRPLMQAKLPPQKRKMAPIKCAHCPMVFVKKNIYTQHLRIHTGEQPFQCEYCSRRFSLKCNRKRHYKVCKNAPRTPESSVPPPSSPQSPDADLHDTFDHAHYD